MRLRTEIEASTFPFQIERNSKILTIGSCFSDSIGAYFNENKIDCLHNPYGVIFNPVSIFRLMTQSLNQQPIFKNLLTENQGLWYHYDFHSKYCHENKNDLENELNSLHIKVRDYIKKADYIFISLGTAYVYRLLENAHIVANCHKKSSVFFKKEMLENKEIGIRFRQFYEKLKFVNPKVKIILTVSPIRHIKDTLQGNNLSKSILRLATHYFTSDFKDVHYFPAYEILLDDLRDYRFYEEDLIHVNEVGQKYVIEHFSQSAFSDELKEFINHWKQVKDQINHKPFQPETEAHQKFLKKLLNRLEQLSNSVNVDKEKDLVKAQLI